MPGHIRGMSIDEEHVERKLVREVASGSVIAFDALYERHAPSVTRYAWALAPTRESAQELVQDTFITLWRNAPTIHMVGDSLLPWLLVTARNHASNQRRAESRAARVVQAVIKRELVRGDHSAIDETKWILDAIEALPALDRQVCTLCLLQGLTYKEAGRVLNMTEGAVGKRLERSRVTLRKVTADEE